MMKSHTKNLILWVLVLLCVGVFAFFGIEYQRQPPMIKTFEDCVLAGHVVVDSIPKRCEISEGQFIVDMQAISNNNVGERGACAEYTFSKYKVSGVLKGNASVDYKTYPDAEKFKDIIEEEVKKGPNFSLYYSVPSWSCGTSCQESAIIDLQTGKILVFGITSQYGVQTTKDSKLLVVNPPKNIPKEEQISNEARGIFTSYYTLENDALVLLCREGYNK